MKIDRRVSPDPLGHLNTRQRQVYAALVRAAENNERCPCNASLAALIGVLSLSGASAVIHALEHKGLIAVERFGAARRVTILATGHQTLHEGADAPHWRFRPDLARHNQAPRAAGERARPATFAARPFGPRLSDSDLVRVDRDPCFRCGTRADIGCRHQPACQPFTPELSGAHPANPISGRIG